jgi:DNA-binding NarL/FixJ family response regulator
VTDKIRLCICDDHRLLTDALVSILSVEPDIEMVADPVDNGPAVIEMCRNEKPDVVLMDIDLNGDMNGIVATRHIRDVSPSTRVVVVSGHPRPTVLVEAIEAGAAGFMDKNTAIDDLVGSVRAAAAGEVLVDPTALASLLPVLATERQAADDADSRVSRLTGRERQVLGLMAEGLRNEAIAGRLFISPATVRTHAQNILSKLDVHSQLEAVALATRSTQPLD